MPTLGEIFDRNPEPDAFRASVESLNGDFPFDTAAMIALGEAYFRRHPDSSHDRDRASVLIGYGLVRVCAVERILRNLSPSSRAFFRAVFKDPAKVGPLAERFSKEILSADLAAVEAEMTGVRQEIEGIPKGPIKERFVGGISHLCTVLYLVRMQVKKMGGNP